mgnify:CR=1 FL=1
MRNTSLVRDRIENKPAVRRVSTIAVVLLWVTFSALWLSGWQPGTYLSLILAWALIPILILVFIGANSLPVLFKQQEIPEGDVVIKVTGDQVLDRPLKEIGGEGLFTRKIEEALLDGRIGRREAEASLR